MSEGPAAVIVNEAGTNTAEVKAASTAAVAADKALVVAVSPNNTIAVSAASLPLPSGAATAANQTTLGNQTTKINDGTNTATVTGANALKVDGSAVTQPVSAASLPLPTGAATEATLAAQTLADNTAFTDGTSQVQPSGFILDETPGTALTENDVGAARIDSKRAQVHVIEDATTRGQRLIITAANAAKVDGSAVTQPVSAAALPLPAGAATSANQTTLGSQTTKINDGTNTATVTGASALKVDGSAVTQPISAASLPLPTGAATEATLAAQTLADNTAFTDGTSQVTPSGYVLDETSGPAMVENDVGAARIDNKRAQILVIEDAATRGQRMVVTAAGAAKVDGSAVTQPVSASSLPLPTGAATEATLATRLADATFTGRINTLGQKTMANSTPIVVASDQTVIPVSDNAGSLTVDTPQLPAALVGGRLDVNVGQVPSYLDANNSTTAALGNGGVFTGASTEVLHYAAIGVSILTDRDSAVNGLQLQWSPEGTNWDQGEDYSLFANTPFFINATVRARYFRLILTNGAVAQTFLRVQVFLSSSAPTPRKTPIQNVPSDNDPAALAQTVIVGKTTGGGGAFVAVKVSPSGAVQVGGTVAADQGSAAATAGAWPIKVTDGTNTATVKAASTAAVAGDTALVVAVSPNNTIPVSAVSLPLPAGAATAANQTTLGSQTTKINDGTNTATVTGANALKVDGSAVTQPISAVSLPLPTGAATDANQTTQITSLQLLDDLPHGMNAAFNKGVAVGGQLDDTGTTVATEDNIAPVRITSQRSLHVSLRDSNGNSFGTVSRPIASEPTGGRVNIHSSATVTASGSQNVTWQGWSEWYLIINLKDAPTGTSPTIQFKIEEVDPIDGTTVVGQTVTGVSHTTAGFEVLEIVDTVTDTFKLSWTVTGAGASWTTVNVTWMGHAGGNAVEGQAEEGQPLTDAPLPVAGVDSGNLVRTLKVDDSGRLVVTAAGASATSRGFALGTMVTTAVTDVPVRATTYTEQSSNAQRSVSSANANDTSAGTGARQIKLTYLDSTGAGPFTEDITLNGTSAVNTVATDICFIEKIEVISVGSGGSNVGIITLFAATAGGGGAVGTIAAAANRTFWAHHYTPTGLSSFITSVAGNNTHTSNVTVLSIRGRSIGGTAPEIVVSDYVSVGGATAQEARNFGTAIEITGPHRLILYGAPAGTPSITTRASFDFYDQES